MCLNRVFLTRRVGVGRKVDHNGKMFGYKSLSRENGRILFNNGSTTLGKWEESTRDVIESNDKNKKYCCGFHIFLDKKDASNYGFRQIFLVEFDDIVSIGKQSDGNVGLTVIARKMKIIKQVARN